MRDANGDELGRPVAVGVRPADPPAVAAAAPRPWPVVLLTALGAWLAAIPLLIVVGMLLGDWISRSAGPYVVGLLVLAGAVVVLRSRSVPLFVEQLAVPALLVGGGSLGFGVFRDLPERAGALLLALLALGLALAIARDWLRVLFGALMAGLLGFALLGPRSFFFGRHGMDEAWLACHGLLLLWLAAMWWQARCRQDTAVLIESLAAGGLLVTLTGLAWLAGMSFLVGGTLGGGLVGEVARGVASDASRGHLAWAGMQGTSALLAALAAAWIARAWPLLRQLALLPVALVAVGLAWLLPTLGAVLLALAGTLLGQRWRLAAAAAVAAVWVVGSFYYVLAWPLAHKALLLVAAGAVLGALAWGLLRRATPAAPAQVSAPRLGPAAAWIAGATVLTLGVAGFAIWQKQDLIAHGQPVYVELAPVDPRSLMQGDFMRLNFRLPGEVWKLAPPGVVAKRPLVLARRDERGVARLIGPHSPGTPLAAGELVIELSPKNGGWTLVTDAWFFREGDGQRWEAAKYGEFRVASDGRALLVGMADAELKPILPLESP
ncbi:MAG: GDYXXLXY domain-containing protein [Rhizobacter sp.]|nr:GDYXXLXY domain-containing protein [Rhizobacter sp.]